MAGTISLGASFKAQTWEEMRMLAEKDESIRECVVTLKELTADEKAKMQSGSP